MFVNKTEKSSGETVINLVMMASGEFKFCCTQFRNESQFIEFFVVSVEDYFKCQVLLNVLWKMYSFYDNYLPYFDSKSCLEV